MTDNTAIANVESIDALRASLLDNINARIEFDCAESQFGAKRARQLAHYFLCDLDAKSLRVTSTRITDSTLAKLAAYGVRSFDFMNDHARSNERFNVYALEKLAKLLRSFHGVNVMSEYCQLTLAMLLKNRERIEAGKMTLTTAHLHASFTKSARENVAQSHLIFKRALVADSTASTQASSTTRMMRALGVFDMASNGAIVNVNFDHALFSTVAKSSK